MPPASQPAAAAAPSRRSFYVLVNRPPAMAEQRLELPIIAEEQVRGRRSQ